MDILLFIYLSKEQDNVKMQNNIGVKNILFRYIKYLMDNNLIFRQVTTRILNF